MGRVRIRFGSGLCVNRTDEVVVLASQNEEGEFPKQLLLDLLRPRQPLEVGAIAAAVRHATATHLKEMRRLLTTAEQNLDDDDVLNKVNKIGRASCRERV